VKPGWHFLTGKRADVDLIRRRLGIYDPDEKRTEHLAVLTVGNEPQGQWVAIPALAAPQEIVRTARRMLGNPAVPQR
jgi:protein SCO1/2